MDGGLVAPERRVGVWMRKTSTANSTSDGWTLFDAAVDWAAGNSGSGGGGGNVAPTVDAGNNATITLPSTAALDGAVSDDGLPSGSSVTQSWSEVSGPGSVTFANGSAVDTAATFSVGGVYVLKLEATDSALSSSDTVTVTVP